MNSRIKRNRKRRPLNKGRRAEQDRCKRRANAPRLPDGKVPAMLHTLLADTFPDEAPEVMCGRAARALDPVTAPLPAKGTDDRKAALLTVCFYSGIDHTAREQRSKQLLAELKMKGLDPTDLDEAGLCGKAFAMGVAQAHRNTEGKWPSLDELQALLPFELERGDTEGLPPKGG